MNKIKLTYFKVDSMNPTELFFDNCEDVKAWIEMRMKNIDRKVVYLFTYNMPISKDVADSEIFITQRLGIVADLFTHSYFFGYDLVSDFHLHEYTNYEDAYSVSLDMREPNPLCYGN